MIPYIQFICLILFILNLHPVLHTLLCMVVDTFITAHRPFCSRKTHTIFYVLKESFDAVYM